MFGGVRAPSTLGMFLPNPGPHFLASIDLSIGAVGPVATQGVPLEPKGLIFVPTGSGERSDNTSNHDGNNVGSGDSKNNVGAGNSKGDSNGGPRAPTPAGVPVAYPCAVAGGVSVVDGGRAVGVAGGASCAPITVVASDGTAHARGRARR